MSLNATPSGERLHIGFFGVRNAGKSSLVNAVTGQALSVVSDVKGTTTDPVKKAMELLPLGPVVIIDTPGLDDEGALGAQRVAQAKRVLGETDIAVLVTDATRGLTAADEDLISLLRAQGTPYLVVRNKADLLSVVPNGTDNEVYVSAKTGFGVHELKETLARLGTARPKEKVLLRDLLTAGDAVVLVVPIDASAPKGRLILPQQQVLREVLDAHCMSFVCQSEELPQTLSLLKTPPRIVVTDSQVFERVAETVPPDLPLTSFSILFARYKGDLDTLVRGAEALSSLKDGDKVLISEGCTHHRQCGDIGTVKLPAWIRAYTGAEPVFEFTSGGTFPTDLSAYRLVIHCGGCMLNETAMQTRINTAKAAGVPMVNYGVAIAQMHGILQRSLRAFKGGQK
ncbi:MAG: [Clostridia bacterium]|nr:[FeFe] hydrogenase H-cluster maturation GTPase HydF [Clostridia bacterium]